MLFMSMATVSFAVGEQPPTESGTEQEGGEDENTTGTITISGVSVQKVEGQENEYEIPSTYTAYKMFDLESYDVEEEKYNYVPTEKWEAFFKEDNVSNYIYINSNGYVEWKKIDGEDLDKRAAEVSKLALEYLNKVNGDENPNNDISGNSGFAIVEGTPQYNATTDLTLADIKLVDLNLGYYLVDSTAGALCGLTTTRPNASFKAKNEAPTITKQVKEDGIDENSGSPWGSSNDADVDQVVEFDTTITVRAGAENYVLHDQMDPGLTFCGEPQVRHVSGGQSHPMNTSYYKVVKAGDKDEQGNDLITDSCDFEIRFIGEFYQNVVSGDRVVVLYTAKLNEDAIYAEQGNKNEVWLGYGNNSHTTHDTTITKTYGFDLAKTTTSGELLNGAKFEIYPTSTEGSPIVFVLDNDNKQGMEFSHSIYRRATEAEINNEEVTKYTGLEVKDGYIRIVGLDKSHYYLKETVAPENYNKLAERKEISLEHNNFLQFDSSNKPVTNTGFQVTNQSGTILPETGAAGTTMFIALGSVVVIATGLLLVTKKRMSMIK